jgi:hypothetical protein
MVNFVTSFSGKNYDIYAKSMLESVITHWEDDLKLVAYYDSCSEEQLADFPKSPLIEYRDLDLVEDRTAFLERMKGHDGTENGNIEYNWRLDALKWCHKVYALTEYFMEISDNEVKGGWLIWMDADVITHSKLNQEILFKAFPKDTELVHLGRTDIDFSETGFIGFNLDYQLPHYYLADIRGCYDIGEVVAYREWTDAFIMTRFINIYAAHGMKVHNLTPEAKGLAVFEQSSLNDFMMHYKGNRKNEVLSEKGFSPDVVLPRYGQLATLVRFYKPEKIVEIGTWNGGRAIEMALASFESVDQFHYIGFDLFEDATEETDKLELNIKQHNTYDAVFNRLTEFTEKMAEKGKTFTFKLHKGNSRDTLSKAKKELKKVPFAFIDGGHSEDTIKSDYDNLKHIPVIVFDDFYSKDENGHTVSQEKVGVNKLIRDEMEGKRMHVLPSQDKVSGGGLVHLAVLLNNPDLEDIPVELRRIPIIVHPKDCVPKDDIVENINANLKLIKSWDTVQNYYGNKEDVIIVSGGGSVDFEEVKRVQKETDSKIICVKHSYPKLLQAGIKPWGCVILDPRTIEGESTHGIVRKSLFEKIDPSTRFFIASMTEPSVTEYITERTSNVYGWHAYSEAIKNRINNKKDYPEEEQIQIDGDITFVTGGTCAAMRAIGMFHVFGFRNFHLFGFDCSVPHVTEEEQKETLFDGKVKYMKVETNEKEFWTTGELLAMAQDCEQLFDAPNIDMNVNFYTSYDTLASQVYQTSRHGKKKYYHTAFN